MRDVRTQPVRPIVEQDPIVVRVRKGRCVAIRKRGAAPGGAFFLARSPVVQTRGAEVVGDIAVLLFHARCPCQVEPQLGWVAAEVHESVGCWGARLLDAGMELEWAG